MGKLPTVAVRNDLESMGVSGLRETVLGQTNEACCGDCRFLREQEDAVTHPCAMGHGRKDVFSLFAMVCPDFHLNPGIDDEIERRSGSERRHTPMRVSLERRREDRRLTNTYCSRLVLPQVSGE